jgi:hypothetical protein
VQSVNLGDDLDKLSLSGDVRSNGERLIRGAILLSPDGQWLITGSGLVFRAGNGTPLRM